MGGAIGLEARANILVEVNRKGALAIRGLAMHRVICWRTKAKSTWGRALGNAAVGGRWAGSVGALTGGVAESTLELAVVTTFSAGLVPWLWPAAASCAAAAVGGLGGFSHG